jgi:hypothetical protein
MKKPIMLYTSGQRVILKANKKEGWPEEQGYFIGMSGKNVAQVQVEPDDFDDDDGLREVALSQIKPFYNHPTDQQRRARHASRLFRQGARVFRLDAPDGKLFFLEMIDADQSTAVGHVVKRKTIVVVQLHQLWPAIQ